MSELNRAHASILLVCTLNDEKKLMMRSMKYQIGYNKEIAHIKGAIL